LRLYIVNYHYYSNAQFKQGIYPVTPTFFANQIEVLSKTYRFLSQHELATYISSGEYPEGDYCLITFDDGLKEQMQAFEWLKNNNVPAVFYVPVKPIQEHTVLDVHKLHHIRASVSDEELVKILRDKEGYHFSDMDKQSATDQYKYDNEIAREIKYQLNFKLSDQEKRKFTSTLFEKLYEDEGRFSKEFYMNGDDIRQIASSGMLGSHGYSHVPLANNVYAQEEVNTSLAFLENLTQEKILSFSYPYGSKAAVDEQVASLFKHTNVVFGLTMWRGVNELSIDSNPYLLYRVDTNDAPGGKNYIPE
jgi:peptidoglycan/xylan/chitin deacetylase (PgdA/CDA1 family)